MGPTPTVSLWIKTVDPGTFQIVTFATEDRTILFIKQNSQTEINVGVWLTSYQYRDAIITVSSGVWHFIGVQVEYVPDAANPNTKLGDFYQICSIKDKNLGTCDDLTLPKYDHFFDLNPKYNYIGKHYDNGVSVS